MFNLSFTIGTLAHVHKTKIVPAIPDRKGTSIPLKKPILAFGAFLLELDVSTVLKNSLLSVIKSFPS